MKDIGVIYKATNLINKKVYIGKTIQDFQIYKKKHIEAALRNDDNNDKKFYNVLRKYGSENFSWEIIDEADLFLNNETLNLKEIYWISYYNSFENDFKGYNMTPGGDGGDTLSHHPNKKEIYKKSGNSLKRKHENETKEEREKRLETHRKVGILQRGISKKGHPAPNKNKTFEEFFGEEKALKLKEKLSIVTSGKNNPFYGKTHTKKTIKVISDKNHQFQEKIFKEKFEMYSEKIIDLYNKKLSIKNIAKELNICYTLVNRIIKYLNLPIGIKDRGLKKRGK